MRLLHVICTTDPESGGPIEAVIRISEVLLRCGHQVNVVSLESTREAESRQFPFPVAGVGRGIGRYRYGFGLKRWLQEHAGKFDAVILHGLWNYSSMGAWLALRKTAIPYFVFAHGMMDPWFKERYRAKHAGKQLYWWLAEGRVLRDARQVLFTCDEERRRARGVFRGFTYQERVVQFGTADPGEESGIQKAAFAQAHPSLHGRRVLLYLGRVHPKKGCDLLVQAFADCAKELPPEVDLVIAGPDEAGWSAELSKLALSRGIANRVHWAGMLSGEVKWGALRTAEAFILPSHQENFGFAVVEALACGRPVLISNKVNIWREVEADNAGLVEPDSRDGTRNLIRKYFQFTEDERTRMSHAARACFVKRFDVEVTAKDFAQAIGFPAESHAAL